MPNDPDAMLTGFLTAGGKVMTSREDTSVLPSWRTSLVHIVGKNVTALKSLAPDTGAYLNEVRQWFALTSLARLTAVGLSGRG
jgi:hypothetical protein